MIRIAIVEDIKRLANSLKTTIELCADFSVTLLASNGKELINALQKDVVVDVIFMDLNMPEMNGIETTRYVSRRWPKIKVVVSTVFLDEQNIFEAILAGASGYLLKDEEPREVHHAIYEVINGGVPMSTTIAQKALNLIRNGRPKQMPQIDYGLTRRETEILEHLGKGLTYEQIASNLFISVGTVRKHTENIYRKLQVNNRIEAINKGFN